MPESKKQLAGQTPTEQLENIRIEDAEIEKHIYSLLRVLATGKIAQGLIIKTATAAEFILITESEDSTMDDLPWAKSAKEYVSAQQNLLYLKQQEVEAVIQTLVDILRHVDDYVQELSEKIGQIEQVEQQRMDDIEEKMASPTLDYSEQIRQMLRNCMGAGDTKKISRNKVLAALPDQGEAVDSIIEEAEFTFRDIAAKAPPKNEKPSAEEVLVKMMLNKMELRKKPEEIEASLKMLFPQNIESIQQLMNSDTMKQYRGAEAWNLSEMK